MDEERGQRKRAGVLAEGTTVQVRPFDFQESGRLTEAQFTELKQVTERFSQELIESLSALVRGQLASNITSFKQVDLAEFCAEQTDVALVVFLNIQPLDAPAALAIDSNLGFLFLEAFLGNRSVQPGNVSRKLTEIESSVLQGLHERLARGLEKAWRNVTPLTFQVREQVTTFKPRQLAALGDTLVVVTVNLGIADITSGQMSLIYPLQIGSALSGSARVGKRHEEVLQAEGTQALLFEQIKKSTLDLHVCLQGATLRLGDLSHLREGDLLRLDVPQDRPMDVLVNGKRRFQGNLLESNQKTSLKIQQIVFRSDQKRETPIEDQEPA